MNVEACVSSVLSKYLSKGQSLLLGVSGGADSMVLLTILAKLRATLGFSLVAAHVNHQLRGQASFEDQKLVESYCRVLDVPLALKAVDVKAYAEARGMNLEEAGRDVRYEFFKECTTPYSVSYIVTAHHKNDFAETVLMNLARGTGLSGLSGFAERQGNILRPLIDVAKDDLYAFAKAGNVPFNEDVSNDDMRYSRNFVRHSIMPLLKELNPDILGALARYGNVAREVDLFLTKESLKWTTDQKTDCGFSREAFTGLDPALQKTVLRLFYRTAYGHERNMTFELLARACDLIVNGETGKRVRFGDRFDVENSYDCFSIVPRSLDVLPDELEIDLSQPSCEIRFGDFSIRCDVLQHPENVRPGAQYLDLDKIAKGLVFVRAWRDGDHFQPLGMSGHKKIQDFFSDQRVQRSLRTKLPLFFDGNGELFAVSDMRISDGVKIDSDTRSVLRIIVTAL